MSPAANARALVNALLALILLEVHGPDGQRIDINTAKITSLRMPSAASREHLHRSVNCVIVMVNGKFIGVIEKCATVRYRLTSPQ